MNSTKVRIELGKILNFLHENQLNEAKTALNNEIKKNNIKPIILSTAVIQAIKVSFDSGEVSKFWNYWEDIGINNHELEFFLQIYFCFSNSSINGIIDEEMVKNGQLAFKSFIENRDENTLPDTDEFQIYFGLPYIPKPHLKSQYSHIFTAQFKTKVMNQMLRFLKTQALTLHDSETVVRQQELFDELQRRLRKSESEIRKLEEDYGNILQLALELMDLLQSSVQGQPVNIGNDIIDRLSARLASRPSTSSSMSHRSSSVIPTSVPSMTHLQPTQQLPPPTQQINKQKFKYNYNQIKNDLNLKGELLQALRLKLTKSTSEIERIKIINEFIQVDILGCSNPDSSHHKKCLSLLTSSKPKMRETIQRFVNTLASIFPGRSYLANSPYIGICCFILDQTRH
jgi:uncharacterized protein YjaG (DUF416 family)